MAARTPIVSLRRKIQAPPEEVYRAWTRQSLLRDWLAQDAQADARAGGRFYLWWSNGDYVAGEFTRVEEGKSLTLRWRDKMEPKPGRVNVTLAPVEGGTEVRLRHAPAGRSSSPSAKALARQWESALENLQSLLETGEDLRYTRRPMLGVNVGVFNAEEAAKLGVPVKEGVRLDGTVEGMGAAAAGLTKDDVMVSVGGRPVSGFSTLAPVLQRFRAGDTVAVNFYRGREKKTTQMTLSGRRLPAIPPEPGKMAAELRRLFHGLIGEIEDALRGVSDERAGRRPAPGEWSVKHILAHIIAGERDSHAWMTEVLEADESLESPGNLPVRIDALVDSIGNLAAMLDELRRAWETTARMVELLPREAVARKAHYWKIGHNFLQPEDHVRGHIRQMREALSAAG